MKKSKFFKKLIEEVIEENLEEIQRSISHNKRKKDYTLDPLDNDINNSTFLTYQGKLHSSLHIKDPKKDGGKSLQRARDYVKRQKRKGLI